MTPEINANPQKSPPGTSVLCRRMVGKGMKISAAAAFALVTVLGVSACATPSADSLAQNDPWESTNRDVFAFDMWLERNVGRPVGNAYRAVAPEPVRDGVHTAITNMQSPVVFANDVLQGDAEKAATTLGRMVVNSTIGIGGLIDVASKIGLPYHDNDFGVTMGKAGAAEGSYVVLPVLGPKPPRDIVGAVGDSLMDPFTWARFDGRRTLLVARQGARVIDTVERRMDQVETLERTSIDFYATVRNLYRQSRNARIRGNDAGGAPTDLPDL